jgi:hypothetical protein
MNGPSSHPFFAAADDSVRSFSPSLYAGFSSTRRTSRQRTRSFIVRQPKDIPSLTFISVRLSASCRQQPLESTMIIMMFFMIMVVMMML